MVSIQFREYIWSKYLVCFVLLAPYSSPQSYSSLYPSVVPGILPWSILWPNLLVSASWLRSWHLSRSEPNGNPCLGFLKLDSKNIYKSVILNDGSSQIWEKAMATYSSILAWRIPWTAEPGELQSMWSQRVRQDWMTNTHTVRFRFRSCWRPWFALLRRKFGLNEKQVGSTKIEVETEGGCKGPDSIPSHSTLVVADAQLHLWPRTVLFFSFSWIPNATKFLCFASVSLSVWDLQSK